MEGVRTCPRCMVGAQRGAGGKHWAHDRLALDCLLHGSIHGSTAQGAAARQLLLQAATQPRATTRGILEPFMKNPAKETAEQRGTNPGGTRRACKRPSTGDQLETEAPTAGDNEAEVEGKETEQEPTQKDTKADASLLLFLELLKYKYSDQEAKRSSLRTGSYYTTGQAGTNLGDTNAHRFGPFC